MMLAADEVVGVKTHDFRIAAQSFVTTKFNVSGAVRLPMGDVVKICVDLIVRGITSG